MSSEASTEPSDIQRITAGPPVFKLAPDTPPGATWSYGGGVPFQVGPHHMALSLNIRVCCNRIIDLEAGGDLLLIDSLDPLRVHQRLRLAETKLIPHPRTGEMVHMSAGFPLGGFVPLGAKRDDGSPHPHAGSGFFVIADHGYPAKLETQADTHIDLSDPDIYTVVRIFQVVFDGRELRVTDTQEMEERDLLPGTHMAGLGFTPAIPDGDDLVLGVNCGSFAKMEAGFLRWRRGRDGRWGVADFRVVDPHGMEPALVRDPRDNSLLMSTRPSHGGSPTPLSPAIYRSSDGGKSWSLVFRESILMGNTPVMLHRALDGTLYLATNRFHKPRKNPLQKRDMLWLWPMSEDRTAVLEPMLIRDSRADFGPSPYPDSVWRIDHPIAQNVRLKDGRWRHLLVYRGLDDAEMRTDAGPTPWTGCYLEEVVTRGEPLPYWKF